MILCAACVAQAHVIEDFFPGYGVGDGFCMFPVGSVTNPVPLPFPNSEIVTVDEYENESRTLHTWETYTFTTEIDGQAYAKIGYGLQRKHPVMMEEAKQYFAFTDMIDLFACLTWAEYKAAKQVEAMNETGAE